jgi:hypothetical protein
VADHVNYLGLGGLKDWQLMATIRQQEYTFVTNNRSDFLALHGREPLHAGVIIIIPSVTPCLSARTLQRGAQTYRRTRSHQCCG